MNWQFQWRQLSSTLKGPWADRIIGEIDYLRGFTGPEMADLAPAIELVADASRAGSFGEQEVLAAEDKLAAFAPQAKSLTATFLAHAHLDMNWMWGYDETAVICIETVRTMLDMLNEFPDFKFSQSQASVYKFIEEFSPDLMERIQEAIHQNRWEPIAVQWTESDMNLPSTESLIQQFVQSFRYLSELLEVDRSTFRVAFMPDTFGHGPYTPEIFAECGIEYVYHGRGQHGPYLARWRAPSGRSVLAYQDPRWYNEPVTPSMFAYLPRLTRDYGITTVPIVYGVGDHGGGPTRRDINRILAMRDWPLGPNVRFGTYHEFFDSIANTPGVVEVEQERNPIFTGCYSSQQRVKEGNRRSERALYVAELLSGLSQTDETDDFTEAWQRTLFNHFHDILPGSGVQATREYALAGAQRVLARTTTSIARALRFLVAASEPDIQRKVEQLTVAYCGGRDNGFALNDRSDGAGVGYRVEAGRLGAPSRWPGLVRPYALMNPVAEPRTDVVILTVWDWPDDEPPPVVVNGDGEELPSSVRDRGSSNYWDHTYVNVAVEVDLKPFELLAVYIVPSPQDTRTLIHPYGVHDWLVADAREFVLRNDLIAATVNPSDFTVTDLADSSGRHLLGSHGAGVYVEYESPGPMSSWIERPARRRFYPGASGSLVARSQPDDLEPWITWKAEFDSSTLEVTYSLPCSSQTVQVHVKLDSGLVSTDEVKRVVFGLQTCEPVSALVCDTPGGIAEREPSPLSVPVQRFAGIRTETDPDGLLAVYSPNAQAIMACDSQVAVTLLRASTEPDPRPDLGQHEYVIAVGPWSGSVDGLRSRAIVASQPVLAVPIARSDVNGGASSRPRLVESEQTGLELFALRPSRSAPGVLLRLGAGPAGGSAVYEFSADVSAALVDVFQTPLQDDGVSVDVRGNRLRVTIPPNRIVTILVGPRAS